MKSIEKLRDCTWIGGGKVNEHLDAIEAEIAERYMLLPVDADGVPIHVGDMVRYYECAKTECVTWIAFGEHERHVNTDGGSYTKPELLHHAKPDPLIELLERLADDIRLEHVEKARLGEHVIGEYAKRIRELMEVDNG